MERKGMTAIVRGLPNSGLMVTLVDDGGQYTLMPRTEREEPPPRVRDVCNGMISRHSQFASKDAGATRCDTGAQAVDGRYASSYKMEYCHLQPTSPPVELTEFPPQRGQPDLGRGSFEVGGFGSGSRSPARSNTRNDLADKVVSSRMSRDSTTSSAFVDSLRKYPSVSPDSSEVVERLLNYSKEINTSKSNRFKFNECITCCQAICGNKYQQSSRKIHPKSRGSFEESPTRDEEPTAHSRNCEQIDDLDVRLVPNAPCNALRKKKAIHSIHPGSMIMEDSQVETNRSSNNKSLQNTSPRNRFGFGTNGKTRPGKYQELTEDRHEVEITTAPSKFEDNEVACITYEETEEKLIDIKCGDSCVLQTIRSIQTSKSLMDFHATKKKKLKEKKMKTPVRLHTMCKKIKHKPKHASHTNKIEEISLKKEVQNLIKRLNGSVGDIKSEEKIKMLLNKMLDSMVNPKKTEFIKYIENNSFAKNCTKYEANNYATTNEPLEVIQKKFIIFWRNHLNRVSEIHRVITAEMLRTVKDFLMEKEKVNSVHHNNRLKVRDRLSDECFENNKVHFNLHKCRHAKKYHRYLTSLRKLIKTETLHVINNNKKTYHISNKSADLTYKNKLSIYRDLTNIKSLIPVQKKFVTNMLLNQYCTRKPINNVYNPKTKKDKLSLKSLSDTYILLHNSSRNKAILTQSKVDKLNLQHGTKLLTSIKKKLKLETNIPKTQNKYNIIDYDNASKSIQENAVSSVSISCQNTNNQPAINKQNSLMFDDMYPQVEQKLNEWFGRLDIDPLQLNNKNNENIAKNLMKEITEQLILLNMNIPTYAIKPECVVENLKYLICRHLYKFKDNENFKLVRKVSDLVNDVLNILWRATNNNQLKLITSLSPTSCVENNTKVAKTPVLTTSQSFESNKNIIEDIYSKVEFCDVDVRQMLGRNLLEDAGKRENNKEYASPDVIERQSSYSHLAERNNKSGVINVAVASAHEKNLCNLSQNIKGKVVRKCDKPNQTENKLTIMTTNVVQTSSSKSNETQELSERVTNQQLHEYNVEVFRNYCDQLPILAITPDLTELARVGVLHNILKIFYMLQEDPDIANDYTYFEFCFEDEIDELLDMLPQTEEMKRIREGWKIKLVMDAVKLIKFMPKSTDPIEFRQKLDNASDRRKLMQENKRENEEAQLLNALRTAEEYLIFSNYHEQNPLIVKIYSQRLVDRINEIYNSFKKREGTSFLKLPLDQIREVIFRELKEVPKPNNNITKEEIDLVNMNDEVAKWYQELPVQQADGINNIRRQILIQALSKKIHHMEKHLDLDEPSVERNMKHEISMFLCNKAIGLENDQDLNINLMVEELTNRLRRKRHENILNYESFIKDLPFSSTIVRNDKFNDDDLHYISHQNIHILNDSKREQFTTHKESQKLPESNLVRTTDDDIVNLKPIPRTTAKGILGTSQIPGPSTEDVLFSPQVSSPKVQMTRDPPQTISVFSPQAGSPSSNAYDSKLLHETNQSSQFTPTRIRHINGDVRSSTPYQRQIQRFNEHSAIRNVTRHTHDASDFIHYGRQEAPRLQSTGRAYDTTSTAQVHPAYPENQASNDTRRDYRKTFLVESHKNRNPNKIRCLCADNQLRPRRYYMCCCQDNFSEHEFCLSPYDYFF